jgi:SAM-dependent methyltransferase
MRNYVIGHKNWPTLEAWLKNKLASLPNGITLLDAGAGELKYKPYCSHVNYISQDFGEYDGKGDGVGYQEETWNTSKIDIISDITDIPLESFSIDAILCSEVFEHLPNPVQAIEEFSRLLKKGGQLILTAPFCSVTHFSPYFYSTGFSKYFYEYHLQKNGFEIQEIAFNGNYFESIASEIRSVDTIAQRFSDDKFTRFERFCRSVLLKALQRMEDKDKGSNEIKCHGVFINAVKII